MENNNVLDASKLFVSFSGNMVLKGMDFSLKRGEVHAFLGQNATGKSAFVSTIMGILPPDSGTITIDGTTYDHTNPVRVQNHSIHTIYQTLSLFPNLSILDNIYLQSLSVLYNKKTLSRRFSELKQELNVDFCANTLVKELSASQKRLVELMRAYVLSPKILILDEPTAFFSSVESDMLYAIINKMKNFGTSILYITNKLKDAHSIADRISVIYDGINVKTLENASMADSSIIKLMTGTTLKMRFPKIVTKKGKPLLTASSLHSIALKGIDFTVHQGEIIGITGISGAGKSQIGKALIGELPLQSGYVFHHPSGSVISSAVDAVKCGIGYIAEEFEQNIVPEFTASMNITLPKLDKICKYGLLSLKTEDDMGEYFTQNMNIRAFQPHKISHHYSGGEKQKISIARFLFSTANVIVVDEPTKFVDIPSKSDIYNLFNYFVKQGRGVIFLTSDFSEACGMCDRIFAISDGKFVAEFSRAEVSEEKIITYAVKLPD